VAIKHKQLIDRRGGGGGEPGSPLGGGSGGHDGQLRMSGSPYGSGGDDGHGSMRVMLSTGGGGGGGAVVQELPVPELSTLPDLLRILTECSPFTRDRLASSALRRGYLRRLLDVFRMCEDLDDEPGCAQCAKVVKALALLNDTQLLEALVLPDLFSDVLGALEHDPEYPGPRPGHRETWANGVVFKEVVPIASTALRARIHATYRLQYLKDSALAHCLDDATFSTLASLVLFNHVEVLVALQGEPQFLTQLFTSLRESVPGSEQWGDLVAFVQEMCGMARHLQPQARGRLYTALIQHGAFDVLTSVLRMPRTRVHGPEAPSPHAAAADILVAFLCHDVAGLRAYLQSAQGHALLTLLVQLFIGDAPVADPSAAAAATAADEQRAASGNGASLNTCPEYALVDDGHGDDDPDGLQGHLGEIMRMLVDPEGMEQAVEKNGFLELWYQKCMDRLVAVLQAGSESGDAAPGADDVAGAPKTRAPASSTLVHVLELLCFCVRQHSYRIKYYLLRTHFLDKALMLLTARKERAVQLAAIRLVRACLGQRDDFFTRYLVKHASLAPVIGVFVANGTRNNALNSAVLELLDCLRRDAVLLRPLVEHLVATHGAQLDSAQIDTYCGTWKALKLRHEQGLEAIDVIGQGGGAFGHPGDIMGASPLGTRFRIGGLLGPGGAGGGRRRPDGSMDSREESYFDRDDDDVAGGQGGQQQQLGPGMEHVRPGSRGGSPPPGMHPGNSAHRSGLASSPLQRLVDYGDEEPLLGQGGGGGGGSTHEARMVLGVPFGGGGGGGGGLGEVEDLLMVGPPRPSHPLTASPPRMWTGEGGELGGGGGGLAHGHSPAKATSPLAKRQRVSAGGADVEDLLPPADDHALSPPPLPLMPRGGDGGSLWFDDDASGALPAALSGPRAGAPRRLLPIKPITLAGALAQPQQEGGGEAPPPSGSPAPAAAADSAAAEPGAAAQ
jgi:protein phosphatase-4 regulatory subunit 3